MPYLLTIFGRYVRFLMCTKREEKPIKQPRDSCPLRHTVTRWQMIDPRCVLHAEGLVPVGSLGCMGSPTDGRGRAADSDGRWDTAPDRWNPHPNTQGQRE